MSSLTSYRFIFLENTTAIMGPLFVKKALEQVTQAFDTG
ncbi:hypothetical protein DEV91_104182 [Phyllobacterium brassicacearum]|nr:hypothetical protein DEV91_104182 [Phyllobacterium brassicacearum]